MPTELLTREKRGTTTAAPLTTAPAGRDDTRRERDDRARRVRRLKLNAAAWALGSILITALWVTVEWRANGALESFGHEGDPGQWNPTLWALAVGGWGLVVGIMTLGVAFAGRRLQFHAAAWALGMLVVTPLWALIEWQDNGAFERWSSNSRPGDWDPWFLYVGGIWASVVAPRAAPVRALTAHQLKRRSEVTRPRTTTS